MNYTLHGTVLLGDSTEIGDGAQIWHNSQIREKVSIGKTCVIGRNVYVGPGVKIGSNCKIQNNALIYEPAVIADGVFIGPGAILTNDQYPRAVNSDLSLKSGSDWNAVGVSIDEGASTRAQLAEAAPQVLDRLDRMLVRWVRSALEGQVNQIDKFEILASSTRDVVDQLGAAHQYLSKIVDASCNRWALLCVEAGQPESGLKILASQRDCDLFVRARCNEAASRWAEAFDDFVGAGREDDAVRCARKGGDYKAAQQLHGNQDDNVSRSLRFVERLNSLVQGADDVELLPEEILQIKSNIDQLVAKSHRKFVRGRR